MRFFNTRTALFLIAVLSFQTEAMAQTTGLVTVSGTQILRDGKPWVPNSINFNGPLDFYDPAPPYKNLQKTDAVPFVKAYGADLIRIFIVQDYLDPEYAPYLRQKNIKVPPSASIPVILNAVKHARENGLSVLLVMENDPDGNGFGVADNGMQPCQSGNKLPTHAAWKSIRELKLPTGLPLHVDCGPSTSRAWQALLNAALPNPGATSYSIKNDMGVMLELFNEPASADEYDDGATGPAAIYQPSTAVTGTGTFKSCLNSETTNAVSCESEDGWKAWQGSHQNVVDNIRNDYGATNVIVAEGLAYGHLFNKMYPLSDPLGQLIYAAHPYLGPTFNSPKVWNAWFGDFAKDHPFIVSEFNAMPWRSSACFESMPITANKLLHYLFQARIGVDIFAYDSEDTLFTSLVQLSPSGVQSASMIEKALRANLTTFTNGETADCIKTDPQAAGWLIYDYFQGIKNAIPSPTNLISIPAEDGFSLMAVWQSAGSNLRYVAAIYPQGAPLYSPPEGTLPPTGTTDVKSATSIQFNNLAPGTYMVEVWSYDPDEAVTTREDGTSRRLYSPPAILENITLNSGAHPQVLDADLSNPSQWSEVESSVFPPYLAPITIASAITAPDGTPTAHSLIENTADGTHALMQNVPPMPTLNVGHSFSVAVKNDATGSPRNLSLIAYDDSANSNLQSVVCDPSTNTLQQFSTSAPMVYLGSGWYLCTLLFTAHPEVPQLWVKLNNPDFLNGNGSDQTLRHYTGDGISGLEVWNPQLFRIDQ